MGFVLGLLAFAAAMWFLVGLKRKDTADCRAVLGLTPVARTTSRGTTPEGLEYSQTSVLAGTMLGRPATLFERFVRHPNVSKHTRRGSHFTVLEFALARPARFDVRLQPAGMLGSLEEFVRGEASDRVPIDADFDAIYTAYSKQPSAAVVLLTPELREKLRAFRSSAAGNLPVSTAGRLASGLVLGTFHVDGSAARYVLFGSPTKATAEQVKAAAPFLLEIADRAT